MHRQNRSLRSASLRFLLPTWLHEGGISATLERLADPYVRSRIRQKIAEVGFNNFGQIDSWADIRIAISPRGAAEPGRTIEEIAREASEAMARVKRRRQTYAAKTIRPHATDAEWDAPWPSARS